MDRVLVRFAFWQEGIYDIPSFATYLITESTNPKLAAGSHVSDETLLANGVAIPPTPTLPTWIRMGRPIKRGQLCR